MAAYLVSLERLAVLQRQRIREGRLPAESSAVEESGRTPSPEAARAVSHGRGDHARVDDEPPLTSPLHGHSPGAVAAEAWGGFAPVQELLGQPKEQIEAWLKTHGDSQARVLLAMLFRMASLESRLSKLEAPAGGNKPIVAGPRSIAVGHVPSRAPAKSELLEQVFHKNLALRRGGMG
ncbi:MAG: hypothetical protein ACE5E5_08160 [Phycisphaerae bacterium]